MGLALYARRSSNTPCKPQLTYEKTRLVPKRENTNQSPVFPDWSYSPSHLESSNNPADQASRGLLPQNLKENLLWWSGPSWLWEPKENWPENKVMEESIINVCMSMGLMEKEEIQL
ncbi:unnamed protein product [Onchocerca ochengi]|uniref:Ovule protein n=1 Tax=Onchocerca ochengi TaxID=42157 RepID=A0A182EXZ1_ONCOC|nr:unnamed protein product [Onchocerca ochengi]